MTYADTNRKRCPLQHAGLYRTANIDDRFGQAIELHEQFIDGISLPLRDQGGDGHTYAVAQFPVQGVVAAEHRYAVLLQEIPHLEVGVAHLQAEGFCFVRTGHNATIRIRKNDDRAVPQLRPEDAFAAAVERVDIHQPKIGRGSLEHMLGQVPRDHAKYVDRCVFVGVMVL